MSFTDTLGKAFKAIGLGPTYSAASSLIYDISSVASNDKPWTTDAFNIAADTFKTAASIVPAPAKAAVSAAWNDVLEPTFKASYELGGKLREPVGAALVGLRSGNFGEAWKQRDEISFGQSLAYMQSAFDPAKSELRGDFNIFDPNDRKIFSDSWEYRTLTGAYDTVATTITDPLSKLGKGLSLARKVMVTRGLGAVDATGSTLARDFFIPKPTLKVTVISPETLATRISEGTQEGGLLQPTLKWFAENDATKIRFHPMVAASNDADTMAWLLGEAKDVNAVADTLMAVGLKDTEAMARLVKRKDLMFVFDKLKQVSSSELDVLDNIPTNGIVDDVFKLDAAGAHLDELAKDPYFQKLSTLTERGADLTKRTFADVDFFNKQAIATAERKFAKNIEGDLTKYPGVQYFQPTKYHPVIAVINWATERPANWINGNDSDSINELYAFGNMLRRMVGKDIANPIIDSHIERYLGAGETVEPKLKVAESFEQMAAAAIHAKLGVPADAAARIFAGFTTRRSSAMAMIRDRKFLMTNDDMILKIPYLERQGGNTMPMLDLEKYYEVLEKNKGLVQALEGSKNIINPQTDKYVAGILNDTWKASVLLRLGYTVRNLTEASMSIMGKGYGLMWAGQLNADAVKYWYENRVQGIERWTDRKLVAKGVREDSVQARRVLAHNQAMLTANAALRKQAEQWAKAAEKAFENGKITQEQLSEYLQMSERSSGEQLYYGTPTALDLDKLDVTRPLAMTQNDAVAERYATSSIPVISASKIQQRLTGRAGRLPKNLRERETGNIVAEGGIKQPTKALQTIAEDMRQGFQNSIAKGHIIETYNPSRGEWREINPNTISHKALTEQEFRVIKPGITGQVNMQNVFGRNVNIQTWRGPTGGLSDYPELIKLLGVDGKAWRKGDAWQGKEKQLLKWMRENEVGKLTLPDVKGNNRHTVLVDPKMIETDSGLQKPTVELATKRIKKAYDQRLAFSKAGYEQALPKDLDAQAEIARIAELIGNGKYPSKDILQTMRDIADNHISLKADQSKLLSNLQARMVEEVRLNTPRKMQGQGTEFIKLYDGTRVEVPSAFAGELGKIFASVTDNAETYRMMVDHPSQLFQARHGYMVEAHLKPTMPEYYSGYANHLNTFFRSPDGRIDPLIEIFLNGGKPEDAVAWLRSAKSADYRTRFNIDDQGYNVPFKELNVTNDASDFAGDLYSAYQRYLPDGTLQETFRNGQADEMFLREHFADNTEMPDLIGRIVPTSPEAANRMERLSQFQNKAFHFLGSLPETTIARHPLARSMYSAEMSQRANIALAIKRRQFGPNAELTLDEINGLRKGAIEGARRELNKTLFTIVRKSYAGEAMRFMMPFFNAWENTIRRWSGLATESPQVIARAGQITQMLANSGNMLDKDGNPTDKFSYDNSLVLPMPETFKNALGMIPVIGKGLKEAINSSGMQVNIPIRSMDVIFQGEAVAGFGPIVSIPSSEIVKMRPDLEDVFKQILPFGPSQSFLSLKQLVPPAAQKFLSRAQQDEQWSRTFNTVYRYELIRFNLGDRATEPTLDEIKTMTNNMYTVKMFSNLILPFAAQYDSPLSFYGKQFRKLQAAYPGKAEEMFLQMYPEASAAMVSASYNPSGAQASQAAYKNTQKYSSLIGKIATDTPELVGFLVNDGDNKYTFSDAVYQWQYKASMAPGSTESFRARRNPALLKREADIKMGWAQYNKGMSALDSELNNYGFTSYNESGAEDLLQRKQTMTQTLAAGNPNWYADLITVDKGKWIYRMQSMDTMLQDPTWMKDNGGRPVVAAIAAYMQKRRQIQRELANRKAAGYSGTLAAQDNADLEGEWNMLISTLKQESEFGQFYNRFLQNDPVTLG